MSDLYSRPDEQMARLQPYSPRAMAGRGLMTAGCWAVSSSSTATGCGGVMRQSRMVRPRRCTTGGSDGVNGASSFA